VKRFERRIEHVCCVKLFEIEEVASRDKFVTSLRMRCRVESKRARERERKKERERERKKRFCSAKTSDRRK
jgi:hypothetical protein